LVSIREQQSHHVGIGKEAQSKANEDKGHETKERIDETDLVID
jgi:hypothetical protein